MRPTILLCLLSFCGYFLLGLIECIQKCEPDLFYVTWPNGSFKDCLHCSPCHPGWGLYPNCGEHITYPPTVIHCKKCVYGKTFSDTYDYSGCKSCHKCAEHEIVTKNCTRVSDTVCSGTCIQEYFYRNATRDCQKCSYCCNDGKDEEQQECIKQGLKATHRYCAPRPDKTCGPAPTSLATTQHNPITTSSAKHLIESKDQQQTVKIALILSCTGIGICSVFGGIHIWRRWRKRRNGSLRNAENGALAIEAVNIPPTNEGSQNHGGQELVRMPRVVGIQQNEGFVSNNSTPQGSCRVTPSHSDDELDESLDVKVKPTKHLHVWKQQKSKEEIKEKNANNSTTERLLDSAQDNNALFSIYESHDEQPGREGAEGGHERKSSRSGSLHEVIFRKISLTKDPTYNPLPNKDPDQPQANNSTTEGLSDSAQDNNALSSISENRDGQPGREGAEGGHERKSSRSGSLHEVIFRKMSLTKDPTYKPLPNEDPDRPQGAPGGHERKRSRSGSIFGIGRKSSISPLDAKPDYPSLPAAGEDPDQPLGAPGGHERKRSRSGSIFGIGRKSSISPLDAKPDYPSLPAAGEDPDQPLGESYPSLTIEEHPQTQKQTEGSRVELKCIVKGGTKVTYQWFKDGEELPEENSSSLILHSLKVQDFGFYKCEVRSCDAGQHNSSCITSNVAELDVAPSAGRGAPGGHERKRSRSGSIFGIGRKSSISPLDAKPDYPSLPAAGEDPDQPLGESYPSLTIEEHPQTQKQTEGSRVELKCIVKGGTKVTYQWFKDGEELPEEKSSSLILHSLKVQDFGFYKCEVRSCDAGQHNSSCITSNVAELDVAPSAGRDYRLLKDVFEQSLDTQRTVENLLCMEIMSCKAWKHVAFKYKMDLNYLNSKRSGNQGEEVIAYLMASNPNLSVYSFCKTLKEDSIRRLDIVAELSSYLV